MPNDPINKLLDSRFDLELDQISDRVIALRKRTVSGTYKGDDSKDNVVLELRVDVDGRRQQSTISGDFFNKYLLYIGWCRTSVTAFRESFIVRIPTITWSVGSVEIVGQIEYFDNPTLNTDTIRIEIPRVNIFTNAPDAMVKIMRSGRITHCFCLPRLSLYFRQVNLEMDRYQGTSFPTNVDMDLNPSPSGLTGTTNVGQVFLNSGINLSVNEDDVLNDPDGPDAGSNWSEVELHQLMEDNFDRFGDRKQWNVYGVTVPRFGDPNYNSGYYGTMFDWGGWQAGDTFLRQGFALAEDATRGRSMGSLYNTSDKKDRLVLQTFCHELGHAFNLPHSWQRGMNPSSSSNSFMNYPWGYTGGTGGETEFWSDFRWEFDNDELVWMRHGNRNDVIFGGNDWAGNNLSYFPGTESFDAVDSPLELSMQAKTIYSLGEPILMQLSLENTKLDLIEIYGQLAPENQHTSILIKKPNGQIIKYVPPVLRFEDTSKLTKLSKGESLNESVLLNYSAKGAIFNGPGEYHICAYYGDDELSGLKSNVVRIRVADAKTMEEEAIVHVLMDHEAAKFLYYKGGYRYPKLVEKLENICKNCKVKNGTVAYIKHVLGIHYSREYKTIQFNRKKKKAVTLLNRDVEKSILYLDAAIKIKDDHYHLDEFSYVSTVEKLMEMYQLTDRAEKTEALLKKSNGYLKTINACKTNVDRLKKLSNVMKKGK